MSQTTARQNAVAAITAWQPSASRVNFKDSSLSDLFGINVFSDEVMREKLPDKVYKGLCATIRKGEPLD
ncbi:MAG TPA: hypothetical protein VFT74_10215, partial [Isosphaeraceae bacterium]|nr:hypothetical protein [Isosphaeraceae bacterium]